MCLTNVRSSRENEPVQGSALSHVWYDVKLDEQTTVLNRTVSVGKGVDQMGIW